MVPLCWCVLEFPLFLKHGIFFKLSERLDRGHTLPSHELLSYLMSARGSCVYTGVWLPLELKCLFALACMLMCVQTAISSHFQLRNNSRRRPLWWAYCCFSSVCHLYFLLPATQLLVFVTGTQPVCRLSSTLLPKPLKLLNHIQVLQTSSILNSAII